MVSRIDRIDGVTGSIAVKAPVMVATTENITLSGAQTVGGVALTADATPRQRVLVKDQADSTQNGIYNVNSGTWTRSPDFDGFRDAVNGTRVHVNEGVFPFPRTYYLSADNPVVIGVDPLVFVVFTIASTETTFFVKPESFTENAIPGTTDMTSAFNEALAAGNIVLDGESSYYLGTATADLNNGGAYGSTENRAVTVLTRS